MKITPKLTNTSTMIFIEINNPNCLYMKKTIRLSLEGLDPAQVRRTKKEAKDIATASTMEELEYKLQKYGHLS